MKVHEYNLDPKLLCLGVHVVEVVNLHVEVVKDNDWFALLGI
jgi:hypothetical protein